ncbi:MAG: xanthine dehydrogenase family protein molybdopterin-binding subunit [Acidimicrobiales bacterium]
MPGSILGNAVVRVEDPGLLRGASRYVDDLVLPGIAHLELVRSPLPHALIRSIDVAEAAAMPGVLAVRTAADLSLPAHHGLFVLNDACARPPLADGKVRFVGDAVAVVVAESKAAAVDASEAVVVDYEELDWVVDPEEALAPGAPVQFESLGSNLAAGNRSGGGAEVLAGADVVVRGRFVNQRVAVVPMEGNAIAVVPGPDGQGHDLTIYVSTQMPHALADRVAALLGVPRDTIRVVAPAVGGAFGSKAGLAAEHTVAIAMARLLGRPVKWVEDRSENLRSMPHGRGQVQYVETGFTRDGSITGMRCRIVADAGAYAGFGGGLALGPTRTMAQGVYRIPRISYAAAAALTNTTPVGAFRGAGRPEAAALLERMMDLAAGELGVDPVELRLRNLLRHDELPLRTLMGATYDSGDYAGALREALRLSGYEALRAEQAERRRGQDGLLLGIGVSAYVEITAGAGSVEHASVEVAPDGTATAKVGTAAHGQGHETSFAMLVAERLGMGIDAVRVVQADTAAVPRGGGTGGSRSLQLGGSAVGMAAGRVWDQAADLASRLLEAGIEDIVVHGDGRVGVAGVPTAALSWTELAAAAAGEGSALAAAVDFEQAGPTFPFGAHVAVVEVDTETGMVRPRRHIAVDDCGRVLNPLIVTGQQHGGIAQGMSQALWEEVVYGPEGALLSSTLADYAIPSAAEVPFFETGRTETPTPLNPLGAKGIGESGTIGSTPAVHNAVVDALSHLGVRHIDMPCTPERVWRALTEASAGRPAPAWREPPALLDTLPQRQGAAQRAAEEADI